MKRETLTAARKKQGYSQSAFAKKLNVSVEHVRSIEYGRTNPSAPLMFKICSELKVPPDILFNDLSK